MSDKLHFISESLKDFSIIDNRGNAVSIQLESALAFDKLAGGSVSCNNGISYKDDGKTMTGSLDGVEHKSASRLQETRTVPGALDGLTQVIEEKGTAGQMMFAAKLLVTGHAALDLGELESPLQTMCDAVQEKTKSPTR